LEEEIVMVVEIQGGDSTNLTSAAESRLRDATAQLRELEQRYRDTEQEIARLRTEIGHLEGILQLHGVRLARNEVPQMLRALGVVDVADTVVEVIREAGVPLHFRAIEQRLRDRGVHGGGKDPANVLLAKYFDDARLYRPARGTYALREWDKSASSVGKRRVRRKSR
jgi:hypothetical protein